MAQPVPEANSQSPAPGVRLCSPADAAAWDEFTASCDAATFFHLFGWRRVVAEAFGHEPYYLLAERQGTVCGVLPLFHLRSWLFGNALISVPFCVYGGVLAIDHQAVEALAARAMELARELDVDYVELRHQEQQLSWPVKDELYVTFRKPISASREENLQAIPRKQRAMIRRAEKAELTSYTTDDTAILYAMYSESVRNLGTPVFSRKYFGLLQEEFGSRCETTIVMSDEVPVAGVMSFYFKDQVLPYYGGGTRAARALSANDFLYWQVMCRAAERGVRIFDYGRSKIGTGSYRFKKHWGFAPQPLQYEYGLVRASEIPDISPANPRYSMFIGMWKKLPLPVTRLIGPVIARNLG